MRERERERNNKNEIPTRVSYDQHMLFPYCAHLKYGVCAHKCVLQISIYISKLYLVQALI